jgi:hypothetical protein
MISKNDLLGSMLRECDICLHLFGKVPADSFGFRFTSAQRSTLELLRYLSFVGLGATRGLVEGEWVAYQALAAEAETLDAADFPAAVERQKAGLTEVFAGLTDADLAERIGKLPWGVEAPLGRALLELAYGSLVAYRMQLFLQAKAAGNASLSTPNCWAGVDLPE